MCSEQKGGCGPDIDLAELHDKAEEELKNRIASTKSITLLKKILATGKYDKQVFARLNELAFPKGGKNGNTEALLEIVLLTEDDKKIDKNKISRNSWSQKRTL